MAPKIFAKYLWTLNPCKKVVELCWGVLGYKYMYTVIYMYIIRHLTIWICLFLKSYTAATPPHWSTCLRKWSGNPLPTANMWPTPRTSGTMSWSDYSMVWWSPAFPKGKYIHIFILSIQQCICVVVKKNNLMQLFSSS